MKFSQTLMTHLTPEWREQYIAYENLKESILSAIQNAPTVERRSSPARAYFLHFQEQFLADLDRELQKVNVFFSQKIAEALRRYNALVDTLVSIFPQLRPLSTVSFTNIISHNRENTRLKNTKIKHLKLAFSELYLSLILLQNYQVLNHTGFRKICKKYDKLMVTDKGQKWFIEHADKAPFTNNQQLNSLIKDVEYYFITYLEHGDRSRAMKRLRVPPLVEVQKSFTLFRLGLFTGAFIVLFAVAVIACMIILLCVLIIMKVIQSVGIVSVIVVHINYGDLLLVGWSVMHNAVQSDRLRYDLFLFRGPLLIITHVFLISVNIYGWRRWGVNHILIFEINPRKHITYSQLSELASFLAVIWTLCLLGFIFSKHVNISPFIFPLLLIIIMLSVLVVPIPVANWRSRLWFLKLLGRLVSAPFFPVKFADFWLGDQLNSLTTSLMDTKNLACFYTKNSNWEEDFHYEECLNSSSAFYALVLGLPAWFRFAQCMRQFHDKRQVHPYLTNAGKYATVFLVVACTILKDINKDKYSIITSNPYVWCFIFSQFISALYGCLWDILGDFGLFKIWHGENRFLRENIIYSKAFYYFVIVENILLRFFWILGFYLVTRQHIKREYMQSILAFSEIIRRYIWNYIRLENEHLYNVGQFRAVRDIFIMPIAPNEAGLVNLESITNKRGAS